MKRIVLILILSLFVIGCQNNSNIGTSNTIQISKSDTSFKEITLICKDFKFNPNFIILKQNDKVRLKVISLDSENEISIPDYNINKKLKIGETVEIEFTADKKGEFDFFSTLNKDMGGKIIVN